MIETVDDTKTDPNFEIRERQRARGHKLAFDCSHCIISTGYTSGGYTNQYCFCDLGRDLMMFIAGKLLSLSSVLRGEAPKNCQNCPFRDEYEKEVG